MKLVTWNVQWCRGVDGVVDPARIVAEARRLADFDVLCLQEIADNYPDPRLAGSDGSDQFSRLAQLLPGFTAVPGVAVDQPGDDGRRRRFGNMILSRLPVGRVLRHSLPWPDSPESPSMPRVAVEAIVKAPFGHVRVVSTHLEYYSARHRAAQIARLGELRLEWLAEREPVDDEGPFHSQPGTRSSILCGDFNLPPEDPLHRQILDLGFVDAWEALNPGAAHPATFRVHERAEGASPYCCDFVFVTPDLAPRLASIGIDGDNRASDHQPLILELS